MDNKQILEEIDIIVRAKVEEARKDLKSVAKETSKMVNYVSNEFKKMNKDGNFDNLSKNINDYKKEIKQLGEEARSVKINMDGISFSFSPEKNDFNEKYQEAFDKYEKEMEKYNQTISPQNEASSPTLPNIDTSGINDEISKASEEVYTLKERLNDFDALTIREELKTVGMQIAELIPQVQQFKNEFQSTMNDSTSLLGMAKIKVQEFGAGLGYIKEQIQDSLDVKADNFKAKMTSALDSIKSKAQPVASILTNIGKIGQNSFNQATYNIKEFASKFKQPIDSAKGLINRIRSIGSETDKIKKKSKGFGEDFGKSLSNGINSIKKFALSLLSIRTAFTAISKASQAYLSFDEQLSNSIQNSWNVLGSLLAPMLEYVASLFSKLVSVIATFVKMLTGIDLVARANAKGLDKQAKATKNAAKESKQLSSIDDIDNLTTNSNSGGGGGSDFTPITVEEIDIAPLEKFFNKAKEILSKIFQPFKEAWENVGAGVLDSFFKMLNSLKELGISVFSSIFEVWTNGTGTEIIENALLGWQQIFDIVSGLADALNEAWNSANNGTQIIQAIANIFKTIQEFGLSIGDSILKWVVSDSFKEALTVVISFIKDILKYIDDISSWLLEMYNKYVKPVVDDHLLPAISEIIKCIGEIWLVIKPVIDNTIQWIKEKLEPIIQELCKFLGNVIEVGKNIAKFFTGVFTGDWQKAWSGILGIVSNTWSAIKALFSAGGQIFVGITEAIANVFKTIVNALIRGINQVIAIPFKELNKILSKIQSIEIVGIKPFSWLSWRASIPAIPQLASGDVAYEPVVAQIGEYANARNNPEIVSPVSMMKDSFRDVLSEFDTEGTRIDRLCINVAGENFYDDTIDYINEKSERNGVSVIKEVE